MDIIQLKDTTSTSDYLLSLHSSEELCAVAAYQSAGRGSDNNHWESEPGKNLLFSLLLHPTWLLPRYQYLMSMVQALALHDALATYVEDSPEPFGGFAIKWPNDIYWHDKKISGTIIDTRLQGLHISDMVIGTGINVNQQQFHSDAPNPVSLCHITSREQSPQDLLYKIIERFNHYEALARAESSQTGQSTTILTLYHQRLYRRTGYHTYKDNQGTFQAQLQQVLPDGIMVLRREDNTISQYEFKEVRFVL